MSIEDFVAKYSPKKVTIEDIRSVVTRSLTQDAISALSIESAYQYMEESDEGHPLDWDGPTWSAQWEIDGDLHSGNPFPIEIVAYFPIDRYEEGDKLHGTIVFAFEAWTDEGPNGEKASLICAANVVIPISPPEDDTLTWENSGIQVTNSIALAKELGVILKTVAVYSKQLLPNRQETLLLPEKANEGQ
jgi:hypothetical protein